jgi:hypothetical protein
MSGRIDQRQDAGKVVLVIARFAKSKSGREHPAVAVELSTDDVALVER